MNEEQNINQLPKGWKWVKLGDVCEKMSNGANAKQSDDKIGFPISRIETIWNETIDLGRVKYIEESDAAFVEKYSLKKDDILFSHINSDIHLGKTAIFKNQTKTLIHGINLLLIRLNKDAVADFLNYQFRYKRRRGEFISIAQKSVNQSSINQPKLKNIDFVLPPKPTQQAIVSKIEELFSELDKGIENLRLAQQQLKTYRQSVLKWAFEGKLTNEDVKDVELPKKWKWVKLGELMESVRNGYSKKPDEIGEFKILRISSVRPNKVYIDEVRFLEKEIGIENSLLENDLLFTRYNGSIDFVGVCGRVPKLNESLFYPDKLIRCRPKIKEWFHSAYIDYAANSRLARQFVLGKIKTTAGQTGISGSDIKEIPIPLAPIDEQNKIVQEIESRLSVADKMEENITQSLRQSEVLRQSILKKAFEGRLI